MDPSRRLALAVLLAAAVRPAAAALDVGAKAPDFRLPAALAGRRFEFSLAEALARGPVVLYFFPAAFTTGCSAEAHAFAEAIDRFAALGATVIGVSADDIDKLAAFSTQACQSRFAVASDERRAVIAAYDAAMTARPEYASRITYVIAPGAGVVHRYASPEPDGHVANALAALRDWRRRPDAAQPAATLPRP